MWIYDYRDPIDNCFNLANPSTANWSTVTVSGQGAVAQLAYTGGDWCYNVQPATTYTLAVRPIHPLPASNAPVTYWYSWIFAIVHFHIMITRSIFPVAQIQFIYDENTPGILDNVVYGATQCDFVATFLTNLATPVPKNVPTVQEVTPTSGPLKSPAGSTIYVIGADFQNTTALACLFGNFVPATAIFHKETVLECVLPSVPEAGNALVQITNDGKAYSRKTDQVFYTFT